MTCAKFPPYLEWHRKDGFEEQSAGTMDELATGMMMVMAGGS
jgi:hypothetical protein